MRDHIPPSTHKGHTNSLVLGLMISDIFVMTGFGLIDPIMAIYINEGIVGGSIFMAGLASTIFFVTKSVVQLPFSRFVDMYSDKFDLRALVVGSIIIAAVPFIYIFSTHIWHIFAAQVIYGVGAGLAYPAWLGLWSTHLDKKRESFEWSFYSTCVGIGTALSATIGAALAEYVGFQYTFALVGVMSMIGLLVLIKLVKIEKKKQQK